MILHVTLKLTGSDSHQNEQNDEGNAQPPAPRKKYHSCKETN
ncbi:hypothetical protein RZO85_28720 [Raoultella ornithinolytica]|nr:hypothetical protein [Raoultella ornithinolytica]MDV0603630.1 hypothetical protein [Raoultella ornithinolytica]